MADEKSVPPYPSTYKERTHKTHMERDLLHVKDLSKSVDIILLGDSHFERLLWYGNLKSHLPSNVFVPSVGGDRVENLLYRIESKDGLLFNLAQRPSPPQKIALMIGGNNLNRNGVNSNTILKVASTVRHILSLIRQTLPQTYLEVWMIPPPATQANAQHWATYAKELSKVCSSEKISYSQQIYDSMLKLNPSQVLLEDGHITETGYQKCVLAQIKMFSQ